MKKITFLLLSLFLVFTSCKKEKTDDSKSAVTFTVSTTDLLKSTGTTDSNISAVVVSIRQAGGGAVAEMKNIELYKFNDEYISQPLALKPGNYELTAFFVVDDNDSVLYVAPQEGSQLDYLVSGPLPVSFQVNKDISTKVSVEVISAAMREPGDFGYAAFTFDIVKTVPFCISIFEYVNNSADYELTSANIEISSGEESIYKGIITPGTNSIILPLVNTYNLMIHKDGFKDYKTAFSADSINSFSCSESGEPMIVLLEKDSGKTLVLQPGPENGKDAWIEDYPFDDYRDRNFGNYPDFPALAWTASGSPVKVRSLIDFDLSTIPQGTSIISAKLSLYHGIESGHGLGHSQLSGSNDAKLCLITEAWDESQVTWNSVPSYTEDNSVFIPASVDSAQDYTDINVTGLVQSQINNPDKYFGFMLMLNTEDAYRRLMFSSSDCEVDTLRPKLTIKY